MSESNAAQLFLHLSLSFSSSSLHGFHPSLHVLLQLISSISSSLSLFVAPPFSLHPPPISGGASSPIAVRAPDSIVPPVSGSGFTPNEGRKMSYHSRRILTPGPSRKRKEREPPFSSSPPFYSSLKPSAQAQAAAKPKPAQAGKRAAAADEPASSNRLLAGYMAYEFLTKGTLFGQKFDPARAEAVPVGGGGAGSSVAEPNKRWKPEPAEQSGKIKEVKEHENYAEVATILKSPGVHIPEIVNPTQLAR